MLRLLRRLRYLLMQRRLERELASEIAHHRTLLEAEGRARRLGNVTLALEDARDVWVPLWIDNVRRDTAYALRALRRQPLFAASMIAVMALGIGATAAIVGLIDGLVLRSLPVNEPARLVYLSRPSFSFPVFYEVRARASHIVPELFAWNLERMNVEWNGEMEPAEVLMASGDFYSTLGIEAGAGRVFGPDDDRIGGGPGGMVAVISHRAWQRRLGGVPDVVGRVIRLQRRAFTIVGVTPPGFFGVAPGLDPEITIPLATLQDDAVLQSRSTAALHLMGRLADGMSLQEADAAFRAVWPAVLEATTNPGMPADRRALYLSRTTSLESAKTGYSRVRHQYEEPLWLLLGFAAVLLLVATASAANLVLARGVARRRELAVRLAIGAARARVVRQLLTEALVWTVLGAGVGLLLASWGASALVAMMTTWEEPIVLPVGPSWRAAAFVLTLAVVTAAASAVVPALRATRIDATAALQVAAPIGAAGFRRWSLSSVLVVVQVTLTVALLAGAGLFARSVQRILSRDAGFDRDSILIVSADAVAAGHTGPRTAAFYSELLRRLARLPGIASASLSWYPPISDEDGAWTQSVSIDGAAVERDPVRQVYFNAVSPDFFATMGIPVLQGRAFALSEQANSPRVAVVNRSLARRLFGARNPIGRRISIGRDVRRQDLEIVGVVGDVTYQHLKEPQRDIAYVSHAQHPAVLSGENLVAELRTSGPPHLAAGAVLREIRALDRRVPIRIQTVEERIAESLVQERVLALLAAALGVTALLLACAALSGLLAYMVSRRTSEIGLRLALGADRVAVVGLVLRHALLLTVVGVAAGLAASAALGRFARHMLYDVSPTDALSLAAAASLMLLVAAGASLLPARRASKVDPLTALRSL